MLHSSGLSGRQWRRLAPLVAARGFRAVVPDFTGHGASDPWPEPRSFSVRTDVDNFVTLLEAEGPAHVVGHSYGALVGLLAALASPAYVRSLALFEPVAFGALAASDAEPRAELGRIDFRWGAADDREHWLRTFVDYWGGDGAWAALREEARAEFRRVGWVVREGVRTLMEDTTPAAAYQVIRCPVTLMTGARSPLAARTVVERLGESLPDARVVTIPGAGHMAPLTHAGLVNTVVLAALAE